MGGSGSLTYKNTLPHILAFPTYRWDTNVGILIYNNSGTFTYTIATISFDVFNMFFGSTIQTDHKNTLGK